MDAGSHFGLTGLSGTSPRLKGYKRKVACVGVCALELGGVLELEGYLSLFCLLAGRSWSVETGA